MEKEIINKAKEILANADTGTNDCKIYNDGFLDGIEYAIKALRQLPVVRSACQHYYVETGLVGELYCFKCDSYF